MADGNFNGLVFGLALITTLFLQILSNLANDFGDFVKGTDNMNRVGPDRTLQAGLVTKKQMVKAMWAISLLCSIFGVWLIYEGTLGLDLMKAGLFVVFGLVALGAAVKYTMGKNPYGYAGLGDLFVFLFFGLLGVLGSYFLNTHTFHWKLLLPASAIGLFTTAVLNINNMRDHVEDEKYGKNTIVVKMGIQRAKQYHLLLNSLGIALMLLYVFPNNNLADYLFLFVVPLLMIPTLQIYKNDDYESFDSYLKKQAIGTFIFSILFVLGLNI